MLLLRQQHICLDINKKHERKINIVSERQVLGSRTLHTHNLSVCLYSPTTYTLCFVLLEEEKNCLKFNKIKNGHANSITSTHMRTHSPPLFIETIIVCMCNRFRILWPFGFDIFPRIKRLCYLYFFKQFC